MINRWQGNHPHSLGRGMPSNAMFVFGRANKGGTLNSKRVVGGNNSIFYMWVSRVTNALFVCGKEDKDGY